MEIEEKVFVWEEELVDECRVLLVDISVQGDLVDLEAESGWWILCLWCVSSFDICRRYYSSYCF